METEQEIGQIVINKDYSISRDKYQWLLHHSKDGESRQGEAIRSVRISYHPSLLQICNTIIERSDESISSVEELKDFILNKQKELIHFFEALKLRSNDKDLEWYNLK